MREQSSVGVQPSGCQNVAQLLTARNFQNSPRAVLLDSYTLALKHWENIDT